MPSASDATPGDRVSSRARGGAAELPDAVGQLRSLCLALPGAMEVEAWGDPTFRVRGRIFAMLKTGDGRVSVWCKVPPGSQEILTAADPGRFFVPPYVGSKGWIGMRLDRRPDWAEVRSLVARSHGLIAPATRGRGRAG